MEQGMSTTNKSAKKPIKSVSSRGSATKGFTPEEKAAMRERARELKASTDKAEMEAAVLARIEEMGEPDRSMARRIHSIIKANAPGLSPRLWYGMPAYSRDGNVICFFQDAAKFKARYATLGFNDRAHLDDGAMWPVAFALKELTPAIEEKISALIKKAAT